MVRDPKSAQTADPTATASNVLETHDVARVRNERRWIRHQLGARHVVGFGDWRRDTGDEEKNDE